MSTDKQGRDNFRGLGAEFRSYGLSEGRREGPSKVVREG